MRDGHVAEGPWTFDQEVTDNFEAMLAQSIPEYETMRRLCFTLGKDFMRSGTSVIDLGASRGDSIAPFIERSLELEMPVEFKLIEVSNPMLHVLRERFSALPNVKIGNHDMANEEFIESLSKEKSSLILSVLTLQFTPIEYRNHIIAAIYDALLPGGAFIFVEKVIGNTAKVDKMFIQNYYSMKAENGYSKEQIDKKRKALEGVLVPVTADYNEAMLKSAQFTHIDCFYRNLNFAGWVAIK